jgi:hypothetical protein
MEGHPIIALIVQIKVNTNIFLKRIVHVYKNALILIMVMDLFAQKYIILIFYLKKNIFIKFYYILSCSVIRIVRHVKIYIYIYIY